jgi:hypothetical protein
MYCGRFICRLLPFKLLNVRFQADSRTPSLGWSGYQTDRLWFSRITHSDVGFDEAEVSIDCCRLFFYCAEKFKHFNAC